MIEADYRHSELAEESLCEGDPALIEVDFVKTQTAIKRFSRRYAPQNDSQWSFQSCRGISSNWLLTQNDNPNL